MEAGGGGAEEEQVMSEVHLGCPPHFSGLHVSRFSFSSRPVGTSTSPPRAPLRAFRHTPSLHCLLLLAEERSSGHGMICTLLNFDSVFSGPSGDNGGGGGDGSELVAATSGSCK